VENSKPFGLYGHSFDGFSPDTEEEIQRCLERAEFIYCRDRRSLDYLRGLGLKTPVLDFGPDGCFGIDVDDASFARSFLEKHGLSPGGFLTATLRSNTPNSEGKRGNILNPHNVSPEQALENERWASRLREVICGWVEATGKKVLLAPEVDKEMAAARDLVWTKLPDRVRTSVVSPGRFWNTDEAAAVYAQAAAVLSMEPHSCIIALANKTPAIHYFSPKHGCKAWMFSDIGLPDWLQDIETTPPSAILDELLRIDARPDEARTKVERAMSDVHRRSETMAQTIRRSLKLLSEVREKS
jgi:polysaccharide pyruvyl transferase WcaK-like protein